MKKNSNFFLLIILFSTLLIACEGPPELPHEPIIGFKSVSFVESDNNQVQDTLKITVSFEDGNGDLGLSQNFSDFPYHEYTYFNREPPYQEITNLNTYQGELLQLGDKPGGNDTLPAYNEFNQPFDEDCINYKVLGLYMGDSLIRRDTVYIEINKFNKNFLLDFLIKRDGEFQEFNFLRETCIPSDGRFQLLNTSDNSRPLEGDLTYNFRANRLKRYFADDTLKLRIQIVDRALNISNTVESPPFTLDGVKIN